MFDGMIVYANPLAKWFWEGGWRSMVAATFVTAMAAVVIWGWIWLFFREHD